MNVQGPDTTPDMATGHGWAIASATPLPLPASSQDLDLIAQFAAREHRLFVLLDEALAVAPPTPTAIDALREALHQVAGIAAFFGKATLGSAAAAIDDQLGDRECATPDFLHGARAALRRAAMGEE